MAVTLEEAEELAAEEGFVDGWSAAESYAARMLPAVFQPEDPVLALTLAPEHAQALRKLVLGIDAETFQADDSLGWTYQFWRALEKDRVNKAGGKIGARELPAVTQLFTEPYMVKFLLHNTLGAWRAGKVLAERPELATGAVDEAALRAAVSPPGYDFDMLRFVREGEDGLWRPAAGIFSGWPRTAAEIRALDPCCGSGHFLTEMLAILVAMRADEEGLSDADGVAAVLSHNLFGLELDGRCVQIAAFAVALTAWRIGGFQPFGGDQVHIAWVGAPPPLDRAEFLALANGDSELRQGLAGLHDLFVKAPVLGSLIDPAAGDLMSPQRLGRIESLLDRLVEKTRAAEPERAEGAVAARGMADAADILSGRYTLIGTNVPFLGRGKQHLDLASHIERADNEAKADLATAMLNRSFKLLANGGTVAAVSPENWSYLGSYKKFRLTLMRNIAITFFSPLGEEAWAEFGDRGPVTTLSAFTKTHDPRRQSHFAITVSDVPKRTDKILALSQSPVSIISQEDQINNTDHRLSAARVDQSPLLQEYANSYVGFQNGDTPRWVQSLWEQRITGVRWVHFQTPTQSTKYFSGRDSILLWDGGQGDLAKSEQAFIKGREAWGSQGVIVRQMRDLPCSLYSGDLYDQSASVIKPSDPKLLAAIWCFCSSPEYVVEVRKIDRSLSVTNATFVKVPFDLARWEAVAAERYPSGLPEPYSDDPTQWVFHGHPAPTETGTQLHVALARLAGYRWPAENDPDMRLSAEARDWIAKAAGLPPADADGILPLAAVGAERPLADRLRDYLKVAVPGWDEARLVREADERIDKKVGKDLSLEGWLRDRAFRQHSALFHNRPFLWQVWDGQRDGFSAFLHYHRLDHAALQKLTYTLLGAWITRREAEKDERRVEAAKVLKQKLETILEGEMPHDIFVRWKPLAQQPLGWNPDLDDGVRLNIRPWITAGVLREAAPKGIKWGVDRGKDVASAPWFALDKGVRNNDRHTTLAEKQAARDAAAAKAAKA
ncbi:hypothetical protein D3C72_614340 [compost metagenome]